LKRILLGLLLAFTASSAWAQCVSNAACATTPCTFNAAGTWTAGTGCTVPPNAAGETWIIQAGHTVSLDQATQTTGTGIVQGTLMWDPGTATRDANGFHNLAITTTGNDTGLSCTATGKIVMRNSDRLRWDTTAGRAILSMNTGCVIDFRGTAYDTTISSVTAAEDTGAPCNAATPIGRLWTIAPASGISLVKAGRRVIFKSGKLVNRHYEIASVGASSFTVCSSLADGSSVGERLTPYGTAPGAPPGPGTAGHHTDLNVTGDDDATMCTGAGAPWPCCSGAGTGICPTPLDPAVGDSITLVDDGWIDQSAGAAGWSFVDAGDGTTNCNGSSCLGMDPLPIIQYMNLSGLGSNSSAGNVAGQFVVRSTTEYVPDFIGNNLHGWKSDYGFVFKGTKNHAVQWNAIHDSVLATGSGDGYCQLDFHQNKLSERGLVDTGPANLDISHNVAWRTKQCAIQINDSDNLTGEIPANYRAQNVRLNFNLIYSFGNVANGITTDGIQINSCVGCQARYNAIFDGYNNNDTAGTGIKLGGTAGVDGTDVSFNWLTNLGGYGIRCDDDQTAPDTNYANCQKAFMVNNYVSHVRFSGGRGGNWRSFVVKNYALDNSGAAPALVNPLTARNGFLAVDSAVAATTLCTASINRCGRFGISYGVTDGDRNKAAVTVSDIVIGPMSENAGASNRFGIDTDQGGALATADFDGTISHITHDNKATGGNGYARGIAFSSLAPGTATTWTVSDLLMAYKNNDPAVLCQSVANLTETIGNVYSLLTDTGSEGGGAFSGTCSSTGTLTRVPQISWNNWAGYDYGLRVGSPEYTSGVSGEAMGARAFRFNKDKLGKPWGGILVFDNLMPVNFSTGTSNADTDGDGVIDFFDNCDNVFNPSQYDGDGDGIGCACDTSGDTCF